MSQLFGPVVGLVLLLAAMTATAQISPGPLSQAHSNLTGPTKCVSCHGVGSAMKCLDCHREIARRLEARSGYHAGISATAGGCVKCHAEHKGADTPLVRLEVAKFDHSKTGYTLEGKHAAVECRKCHSGQHVRDAERGNIKVKDLNRTFLGLQQNCQSCHADQHRAQFADIAGGCAQCHTFAGFKGPGNLKFEHARARFQLTGKHSEVACQKCHLAIGPDKVAKYVGLEFKGCASCHKDPHRATIAIACEQCHNTGAWRQVKVASSFNHSKEKFELAGKHLEVRCEKCHASADFKKPIAHRFCADCHKQDIHNGQFKQRADGGECASCHSVNGFKPAKYDVRAHAGAGYPLEGKHAELACAKCHVPAGKATLFRLKHARCLDCHKDSHQGQLAGAHDRGPQRAPRVGVIDGNRCESCHTVKGFGRPTFTLARHQETQFPLTGEHRAVPCIECHKPTASGVPGRFRFDDRTCSACHEDPHRGQFRQRMAQRRPDGSAVGCEACHTTRAWHQPARFDHASTKFPLLGTHRTAPCTGCHKPPNLETTLKHVDFTATPKRCQECHQDQHGGQFARHGETSCADCHNPFRWKPSLFDHNRRAGFALTGVHRTVRCTDCHKNSRSVQDKTIVVYKPTPSKCVDCHRATVSASSTTN